MVRKAKRQVEVGGTDKVSTIRRTSAKPHRNSLLAYEHVPIGIVKYSLSGTHIATNEQYCRIVGYDKEELSAVAPKDLTYYEDYPLDLNLYRQLLAGEIPFYELEKRLVRKDGEIVWVEFRRSVIRNKNGKPLYTIGTVFDISERRQGETRLRLAREQAELSAQRLSRLHQITTALNRESNPVQLAEAVIEQGVLATGANAGILVEVLTNGQEIRTIAAVGYLPAAIRTDPVSLSDPTPMSDCIRTCEAICIGSHDEFAIRYPSIAELRRGFGNEATACIPLLVGDRAIGGLAFSFVEKHEFTAEEREFLLAVARQCALGLERAQRETALSASEERLRLATEAASICVWELDIQRQVSRVGDNFAEVLGFSPDLLPKSSTEILQRLTPADDIQMIQAEVTKAIAERTDIRRLQYRIVNPENGRIVWIEVNGKITYDLQGRPQRLFGIAQNITERVQSDEALRESEERFRAIVNQATAGIVRDDVDGKLVFVNQAFCNMLQYHESELVGKTIWQLTYAEDIENNKRLFDRMMKDGTPFQLEKRLICSDGSALWTNVSVSPILDAHGKPQSAVAVIVDINRRRRAEDTLEELNVELETRIQERTESLERANEDLRAEVFERKQIEDALRESESTLRKILDVEPDAVVITDESGIIMHVNAQLEKLFGYPSGEILGKPVEILIPERFSIRHRDHRRAYAAQRYQRAMGLGMNLFGRRKDNHEFPVDVMLTPMSTVPGWDIMVTIRDITRRKEMENALHESQRRLQVLAQRLVDVQEEERRAIARELHDRVGQDLIAVNLNLKMLNDQFPWQDLEQPKIRLADSMSLVTGVIGTVRNVMAELRPTTLDDYGLIVALREYLNEFRSRYAIHIRFEEPSDPLGQLGPSGDMTLLRITQEALMNVARHAQASEATISLWQDSNTIYLSIVDNGVGMPSWKEENRPESNGMRIMRERAEAVGGNFRVSSQIGTGTKIDVSIPLQQSNQSGSPKDLK